MTEALRELDVQCIKGVGPRLRDKLGGLGIHTVQDLLFHLPLRYQDRTRITPVAALQPGADAVIVAEVMAADVVFGRRRSLVCRVRDGSGLVTLRFFHFNAAQKSNLQAGQWLRCYGEPRRGSSGLELYHPEYELLDAPEAVTADTTLTPVYPGTEGISQPVWRRLCGEALAYLDRGRLADPVYPLLPASIGGGGSLADSISYIHHPPPSAPVAELLDGMHRYQRRLAFEELVSHNIALQQLRAAVRAHNAPVLDGGQHLQKSLLAALPFKLTAAQQRVSAEIAADLSRAEPMMRLVQGDVGSGKTLVAALAALQAIGAGYQVALMAPTELLAEQHLKNFRGWFGPLDIEPSWLSGKLKGKARTAQLAQLAEHGSGLIIGTHALFQEDVEFANLGLVIVDEQHRFGVHQRLALREKGKMRPHQLIMTATPIPRTLAMTAYADLDTSVIDELPPGRTPVGTAVVNNDRRPEVIARLHNACREGQQAYWVCTLIEESDSLQAQAAEDSCLLLAEALPDLRVALVHGRLKATEKSAVMIAFAAGDIDVLVATTVIEVGVDVPNASLMVIENAERLGLAQLHQLRGRVGRGQRESHCVLMYQKPLSRNGRERLQVLRDSNDGFVIAEKDLQLRGPGEVLGTRQTGLMQFRMADIQRDADLIEDVRRCAATLLDQDPKAAATLVTRWLGEKPVYAGV